MKDAIYVVNTAQAPESIRERLPAQNGQRVYAVDATKIALDCFGRPLPNSSMLGALCRATAVVPLDILLANVEKSFGKKFDRRIIDGNLNATQRGYEEVRQG